MVKLSKLNPVKWLDRLVPPGSPTSLPMRRNVILLLAINIICYAGAVSNSDVLILYPQVRLNESKDGFMLTSSSTTGRI